MEERSRVFFFLSSMVQPNSKHVQKDAPERKDIRGEGEDEDTSYLYIDYLVGPPSITQAQSCVSCCASPLAVILT